MKKKKKRKKTRQIEKMMEDDQEGDYKMYAPVVRDLYPPDIISELIQKSNEQNTGKGVKKRNTNTKKNKKFSKGKGKSKKNRNSKRRI